MKTLLTSDKFITYWSVLSAALGVTVGIYSSIYVWAVVAICLVPLVAAAYFFLAEVISRKTLSRRYGDVHYKSCFYEWKIEKGGDLSASLTYELVNHHNAPLEELPTEKWIWWGRFDHSIRYRILDQEKTINRFSENGHKIYDWLMRWATAGAQALEFSFKVHPPIEKNQTVRYEVFVQTKGSEVDAFSPAGTICGFPVNIPCGTVTTVMHAPDGHSILPLGEPIVVLLDSPDVVARDQPAPPKPELNQSATLLTWKMDNPTPGFRYWLRYRIVENTYDKMGA